MKKRVCPYCKQEFSPNRLHPEQVVCSFPQCQRRRRTEYHRRKIEADPAYRALYEESRTYWKERNPDYQSSIGLGPRVKKRSATNSRVPAKRFFAS